MMVYMCVGGGGVILYLGIPVAVEEDDSVSREQIHPFSSRPNYGGNR